MIYWVDKRISLPQQKHFVRPTKQFCYKNRKFLLDQQNGFVRLIKRPNKKILLAQKTVFCTNNKKILLGQVKPFFQCGTRLTSIVLARQI